MAKHYSYRLTLRLSKNYNSMEASCEFGRDAREGETTEALIKSVEAEVEKRLNAASKVIDDILGSLKK